MFVIVLNEYWLDGSKSWEEFKEAAIIMSSRFLRRGHFAAVVKYSLDVNKNQLMIKYTVKYSIPY